MSNGIVLPSAHCSSPPSPEAMRARSTALRTSSMPASASWRRAFAGSDGPGAITSVSFRVHVRRNSACDTPSSTSPSSTTRRSVASRPSQIGHQRTTPRSVARFVSPGSGTWSVMPVASSTRRACTTRRPWRTTKSPSSPSIVSTQPGVTTMPAFPACSRRRSSRRTPEIPSGNPGTLRERGILAARLSPLSTTATSRR